MARLALAALLLALSVAARAAPNLSGAAQHQRLQPQDASLERFRSWAEQHGKSYLGDREEFARRHAVWAANVARIAAANAAAVARGGAPTAGLTAHADATREEFAARYLGAPMAPRAPQQARGGLAALLLDRLGLGALLLGGRPDAAVHWRYEHVVPPASADWRGAAPRVLGPIKDQHVNGTPCGSCWAFSAVSIMEIASAMTTGSVVSGSEQQLIDCDRKRDHGCEGGGWLNAIIYTIKNKGLTEEAKYPYTGVDGSCDKALETEKHTLRVDSWEDVPFSNETAMTQAVSVTPIITAICVGPALDDWHHYAGGIFDAPCCEKEKEVALDHGIVVVGYGEEGGVPYWVLKNSWGEGWGEKGFMRIRRNHGKDGKCRLAMYPAMVFRRPLPA
ncbi:Actinidain [Scenedesmus sp. PABB004]|nr:Actinidain [Scenedesmus sp. PABB004]